MINNTAREYLIELENLVRNYGNGFSSMYFDTDTFGSEYGFLDFYRDKAEEIVNLVDDFKKDFTEYEIGLAVEDD
jgi:hypothetical protein